MRKKSSSVIVFLVSAGLCLVMGILLGEILSDILLEENTFFWYLYFCAAFMFSYLLELAVHEGGHLVFGLLSGYRFVSYRVGSYMWAKKSDGKVHFYRFSLAGTGGQCLMGPPDYNDGKMPQFIYNMGGVFANLITAGIAWLLFLLTKNVLWISLVCLGIFMSGIILAVFNGVPMRTAMIDNDGKNALSLRKNPAALFAFWSSLKVNEEINYGKRLRDLPEEWFRAPEGADHTNALVTALDLNASSRLLDKKDYAGAKKKLDELTKNEFLPGVNRYLTVNDWIYCALMTGEDIDQIDSKMDKTMKKMEKAMKTSLSVIRTKYAVSLLKDHDPEKAEECAEEFSKAAAYYPNAAEIESEKELMDAAKAAFDAKLK